MARVNTISSIILSLHPLSNWLQLLHSFPLTQLFLEMGDPSPPPGGAPRQIALEGLLSQRPNEAQARDMKGIGSHAIAHGHTQGLRFGVSAVVGAGFGGCE